MKNINKKLLAVLMSTSLILTACSDKEEIKSKSISEINKNNKNSTDQLKKLTSDGKDVSKIILNKIKGFNIEELPVLKPSGDNHLESYKIKTSFHKSAPATIGNFNTTITEMYENYYIYTNSLDGKIGTQEYLTLNISGGGGNPTKHIVSNEEFAKKYVGGSSEGEKIESYNKNVIENMNKIIRDTVPKIENIKITSSNPNEYELPKLEITSENYIDIVSAHLSEDELKNINKDKVEGNIRLSVELDSEENISSLGYSLNLMYIDKEGKERVGEYDVSLRKENVPKDAVTKLERTKRGGI